MKKKTLGAVALGFATIGALASCGNTPAPSSSTSSAKPLEDDKVHIIVLAGQSGARGKGLTADLTSDQKEPNEDVYIYQDGYQMSVLSGNIPSVIDGAELTECKPGYGDSASEIGPEIGIAQTMQSRYTGSTSDYKAVIVKFTACGSDFTNHWYSNSMIGDASINPLLNKDDNHLRTYKSKQTGPLTHNLYLILQNCIDELKQEGFESVIDGLAWVHGEMDAQDATQAPIYEKNLGYFINDFRAEFGANIPVAVSEIFTNCPQYKEKVAQAQKNVAQNVDNVRLVSTAGLHTNPFEPWHFSAQSNVELGNRLAACLLADYDSRQTTSLMLPEYMDGKYSVPFGYDVKLPDYLPFEYSNGCEGLSKVTYKGNYDKTKTGTQQIAYEINNVNGVLQSGTLPVNVVAAPLVDGKVEEKNIYTEITQDKDNSIKLYYATDENGVYFAGEVTDDNVWSDSELWSQQDMGQMNRNDDIRLYVIKDGETNPNNRYSICLSAADMFRSYEKGTNMYTETAQLPNKNRYFKNKLTYTNFRATINGEPNSQQKKSIGWSFEFYVAFEDIDSEGIEDFKVCFLHSDISNPNGISGKAGQDRDDANSNKYIVAGSSSAEHKETEVQSYFSLGE